MKKTFIFIIFFFWKVANINAQQTVGLFFNDSLSLNGYTLFSTTKTSYLIDNCGFVVKTWESNFSPGLALYLLENGNLLRTARIGGQFNGGGIGGRLELFDWDGNVIWSYNYATIDVHQHHDIEPLPNGNILILAWEKISADEAIEAGRNPLFLDDDELWPEHIIEIEMEGTAGANIVWEWHLWDHLIQDFDSTKSNYGVVADHPELVDVNFLGSFENINSAPDDWIHANAVSYNEDLDQIAISSRIFSEIWIIDHSTSTQEAASHLGGKSGKGGDILYRWGNPLAYDRGTEADQKLFGQHDIKWIKEPHPLAGNLIVFNNGALRPDGNYSSIDIWTPPMDDQGNYIYQSNMAFGPDTLTWTYQSDPSFLFFSNNVSGVQALENGNIFICEGRPGCFFEVTLDGQTVWKYINPISGSVPVSQGVVAANNSTFRATRYAADYPAFEGKNLEPGLPIELNPWVSDCIIHDPAVSIEETYPIFGNLNVFPNPFNDRLSIQQMDQVKLQYKLVDFSGKILLSGTSKFSEIEILTENFRPGIYFLQITTLDHDQIFTQKLIKI